jgi:hypothetical protein
MVLSEEIRVAAFRGDTAAIQEWFETGSRDPDDGDQYGNTLLHLAARNGHCDTIRFLLGHGASLNVVNSFGNTPLRGAAFWGQHDAAVVLLDRGALIESRDNGDWTPLIEAASEGHRDMIRLLLSRGAALDARDNDGDDAEAYARFRNRDEAADLLAGVRLAGGWHAYLRYPRKRLLTLRVLCERGRAKTEDGLLLRLFPWHPPAQKKQGPTTRASRRARTPQAAQLPKEVFWLVLKFWRSDRDSRY